SYFCLRVLPLLHILASSVPGASKPSRSFALPSRKDSPNLFLPFSVLQVDPLFFCFFIFQFASLIARTQRHSLGIHVLLRLGPRHPPLAFHAFKIHRAREHWWPI